MSGVATQDATNTAGQGGSATPQVTLGATTAGSSGGSNQGNATLVATANMNTQVGNAYLGILAAAIDNCGIRVMQLIPDSPAVTAQLQVGDVIVAVDGRAVAELCVNNSTGGNSGSNTTGGTGNSGCGNSSSSNAGNSGNGGSGQSATAIATNVNGTGNNNAVGANDVDVNNTALVAAFLREISSHRPGDTVTLVIQRAGQQLEVRFTLGAIPPGLLTPVGSPTATSGGGGTQPTQPAASATSGASVTPNTTGTARATSAATTTVTVVP